MAYTRSCMCIYAYTPLAYSLCFLARAELTPLLFRGVRQASVRDLWKKRERRLAPLKIVPPRPGSWIERRSGDGLSEKWLLDERIRGTGNKTRGGRESMKNETKPNWLLPKISRGATGRKRKTGSKSRASWTVLIQTKRFETSSDPRRESLFSLFISLSFSLNSGYPETLIIQKVVIALACS